MLDTVLGIIAPHACVQCGRQGSLLCPGCQGKAVVAKRSTCFMCNTLTEDWKTCSRCRGKTKVGGVIVASHYEGTVKQLVRQLKYQRAMAAVKALAGLLAGYVPIGQFDVITSVPTSSRRMRQRGYNHAELIAKQLAKSIKPPYKPTLVRAGHSRQVGTNRRQRLAQMDGLLLVKRTGVVKNRRILVIDDVVTTGATINEAGRALKGAGAKSVWGAAIAKH